MSLQTNLEKGLEKVNFLASSIYERHDLTNMVKTGQKFIIRQGDLVITDYEIDVFKRIGLRGARLIERDGVFVFRNSHFVIPTENKTLLIHNEHGVTVIPIPMQKLNFYTFDRGGD